MASECPLGHEMAETDQFCPICGFETIGSAAEPHEHDETFDGAGLVSLACYVGAGLSLLVALLLAVDFSSITRLGGANRQEFLGDVEILGVGFFLGLIFFALGYLIDMASSLIDRTDRSAAAAGVSARTAE